MMQVNMHQNNVKQVPDGIVASASDCLVEAAGFLHKHKQAYKQQNALFPNHGQ